MVFAIVLAMASGPVSAADLKVVSGQTVTGFKSPESVAYDTAAKALYVGEFGAALKPIVKDGAGRIGNVALPGIEFANDPAVVGAPFRFGPLNGVVNVRHGIRRQEISDRDGPPDGPGVSLDPETGRFRPSGATSRSVASCTWLAHIQLVERHPGATSRLMVRDR